MPDSAGAAEPKEVLLASPDPLPAIWDALRAGSRKRMINWPWDIYGSDFGSNAWGYRGLAGQGPSGWRSEIRDRDDKATRLFWARWDAGFCLGMDVDLTVAQTSAMIYFQLDEFAGKAQADSTVDMRGQTVSSRLYFPTGIEGSPHAPNGVVLFFQDDDWTWAETPWQNVFSTETNRWMVISAHLDTLAAQQPEFDPSRVRRVGIKIGAGNQADDYPYTGPVYVDYITASAAPEIQFDFNSPDTRTETEMKDVAQLNVQLLRWWLFTDLRAGVIFDANGFVTGLDPAFLRDLDEQIRLARVSGMYLVPVLFDFLMGGEARVIDGVQTYGRADLILDPAKRQSLLDHAVAPVFEKLAQANEVAMIDLFNEPEWLLINSDAFEMPASKRPPEIQPDGIIDLATMKTFFSELIALYQQNGSSEKALLTIGSASPRWVTLWADLDLDMAQFHLWNGSGQIDEGLRFDFAPPIKGIPTLLGEFSTLPESLQNTCEIFDQADNLLYWGVAPWAYRAKDHASLLLLGDETRDCLLSVDFRSRLSDFNWDGKVDFNDFVAFAGGFGRQQGDVDFDARFDLSEDGFVNFLDFVIFAQDFGKGR